MKNKNIRVCIGGITLAAGLLAVTLSGCGKKCEYSETSHIHQYQLQKGNYDFIRFSSLEKLKGWQKTEKVIMGSKRYELDSLDPSKENNSLIPIKDNIEELMQLEQDNLAHEEYQFAYEASEVDYYLSPKGGIAYSQISLVTSFDAEGEPTTEMVVNIPVYKSVTKFDWTTDINHDGLTGKANNVITTFRGIKIGRDDKLLYSDWEDDFTDIKKEYEYFSYDDCIKTEHQPIEKNTLKLN